MNLRISYLYHPVTALGPGVRFGVWVQGCSIGCAGCMSKHTWDPAGGNSVSIDELVGRIAACRPLDGVTLSGGEPFEQPEALLSFLVALGELRAVSGRDFDVLCFSGLPWRRLREDHAAVLERLDAVVPEPYVATAGRGDEVGGSANQPLILLSDRGRRAHASRPEHVPIQIVQDGDKVACIGTPAPRDLERLAERLELLGIEPEDRSWLT